MVNMSSGNFIPMNTSFVTRVLPSIFTSLILIYTSSPALAWEPDWGNDGYHNYNRRYHQNYYQQEHMLESVEYNGRIIITGIRPRTDICSLVGQILGHCDGYQGFNESTRTHIFRNYPQQQYDKYNQWRNSPFDQRRPWLRNYFPNWNGGGRCVYQDRNVRVLCN